MRIATIGSGERLNIVKSLMKQNKVEHLSLNLSKKGIKKSDELENCFLIFLAVAPEDVRECCRAIAPFVTGRHAIVHLVHALESQSQQTLSRVLENELSTQRFAFLSGPMCLNDVQSKLPSSAICATQFGEIHEIVAECLSSPTFRVYRSSDLVGAEIAAVYARVIAFCAGIAFELGESVKSMIVARGLSEASHLVSRLKGDLRTPFGLSGLANLHLALGDNPSLDTQLGTGLTHSNWKKTKATKTHFSSFQNLVLNLKVASENAGLSAPILTAANELVQKKMSAEEAMAALMSLPIQNDF